jgi:hypothetical protein
MPSTGRSVRVAEMEVMIFIMGIPEKRPPKRTGLMINEPG